MPETMTIEPEPTPTTIPAEFTGTVRDVDYGSAKTQVLIGPHFIGTVKSDLLQDVLQTSLISERAVRVTYYGKDITRAVLIQTPTTPCPDGGCVLEIDCTGSECTALVDGEPDRLRVIDRRTLGILLTAINDGRRVDNLAFDENRIITRVKVNMPKAQA
jgi:hypothetical protein